MNTWNGSHTLDLVVENMGRVNVGPVPRDWIERKGMSKGEIWLDGIQRKGFEVIALEFKSAWVKR